MSATKRLFQPAGPPRYRHQKSALRKIIETRGVCALLMDPGTGKTATALDYASLLALKAPTGETRVLVIAPLVALDTWILQSEEYVAEGVSVWSEVLGGSIVKRGEALKARGPKVSGKARAAGQRRSPAVYARHADGSTADRREGPDAVTGPHRLNLLALGIDSLSSRRLVTKTVTVADRLIRAIQQFEPDLVIIDESHRIKGTSSNVSRAAARVSAIAPRRLILTGTVMPHSPLDVWSQWRFLESRTFGSRFSAFEERYCVMGGWMGKEVISHKNLHDLRDKMSRNAVVVRKEDALDLPPTLDTTVRVALSPAEERAYREMKESLATALESGALAIAPNRLTQTMRLRQIAAGFAVTRTKETERVGRAKVDAVKSLVEETLAGEKRVVIFAHFIREVEDLAEALAVKGTEVMMISGSVKSAERLRLRQRFGSDAPERIVLVAQARTLSLAVNELVTSSHAIFASLSERRDDWIQARDRLDRIGQERPVTFWNMQAVLADGTPTVDGIMHRSHRDRSDLESSMLDHIREVN